MFILGIVLVFIGLSNRKGNISSLHSYHRNRVSEEDRIPFGKQVGLGTIICGGTVMICGCLTAVSLFLEMNFFAAIGSIICIAGVIIGVVIMFHAMIKYNKGIF